MRSAVRRRLPETIVTRAPTASRFELVPSRLNLMKWPGLLRSVVQINERFVLIEYDRIETPVVIEVADGQTATEVQRAERLAGPVGNVAQATPGTADQELQWHRERNPRATVQHMTVGGEQVEPTVVIDVRKRDAEAQKRTAERLQTDYRGLIDEATSAEVTKEGCGLAEEVGNSQVEPPITIEVAARDSHPRFVQTVRAGGYPSDFAGLLEPKPPPVVEQVVGRHIIGDEQIDFVVVVQIGRDDPQPAAVGINEARLARHIDKPPIVIAEDMIRQRRKIARHAHVACRRVGVLTPLWFLGIVEKVVADIKVEVAVAVQVGEGRRGRPVAIATQSGLHRHVVEPPIAFIAIQCVRVPARDKEIRPAVIVEVTDRDSVPVTPRKRGDARAFGRIFERAVTAVAEQPVAVSEADSVGGNGPP